MYISTNLVYLEFQKTGSAHIRQLLARCIPGEQKAKHNRLPEDLTSRFTVGSVRNPWAWYVSLWAFGCLGRGNLRSRLTGRPRSWTWLLRSLASSSIQGGRGARHALRRYARSRRFPHTLWAETYTHLEDAASFKKWLRLVYDPERV